MACESESKPAPAPRTREITDCTFYCFQLISDVYHVHEGKYISKSLWNAWEREIKHILAGRIFRREWEVLALEFSHNDEFLRYINGLMPPDGLIGSVPEPCDPSVAES